MTQITLQAYLTDIQKLLDDNRLTEAIAHCKHILQQYPRYIEAYRLLGKALLEQHEYVSAADVFQRILSADPEDFLAYVGLAVVYKAEDLMNEAIWHMERAYEFQPYNTTIQHELRDLYAWRDGELKTRELQLTSNALARLHFNAELYQQAVSELRTFLNTNPNRVDAQVLLAEALWRDNQRVDAVEVCLQLLEILPYCIKANAILSEIWLMTGRMDEAQEYLQKLQALVLPTTNTLNEDSPVGHAFSTEGAISVPLHININKLDKVVEEEVILTGAPDWVNELELSDTAFLEDAFGSDSGFRGLPPDINSSDQAPDWLQALTTPSPIDQGGRESADVLDWLREVASGDTENSLQVADDLPDTSTPLDTEATLPDWLSEVLDDESLIPPVTPLAMSEQDTETVAAADTKADDEAWLFDDTTDAPPGVPDWMDDTPADLELHAPAPREALAIDTLPDWLDSDDSDSTFNVSDWFESTPTDQAISQDDEQLSSWLDSLAGDAPGATATPAATSESHHDDLPDWFSDMAAMSDASHAEEAESLPQPGLPDWLKEESTESKSAPLAPSPPQKPTASSDLPDWLSDLTDAPSTSDTPAAEVNIPDWLADIATGTSAQTDDLETQETQSGAAALPDWLTGLSNEPDTVTPDASISDWSEWHTEEVETSETVTVTDETDLEDWISQISLSGETDLAQEDATSLSDWFDTAHTATPSDETNLTDNITTNEPDLPDWLSHFPATDESLPSEETSMELSDWLAESTLEETEETAAQDEAEWLLHFSSLEQTESEDVEAELTADWLKAMPESMVEDTEQDAAALDWQDDLFAADNDVPTETTHPTTEDNADTSLPDWLKELNDLDDSDDTAQKKTEFISTEPNEAPSSLAEPLGDTQTPSVTEREKTTMSDSPQKNSHGDKPKSSPDELDWLDELANLPLDEPSTIPSSEDDVLSTSAAAEPVGSPIENEDLGEADMAWLDALGPTDAAADQTLDWFDQMDQPEVEEAPTLSWLSDDDLRGQATGTFGGSDQGNGEDLEEAMSWLESLVTDPTTSSEEASEDLVPHELSWLDEVDNSQVSEAQFNDAIPSEAEEMPTTVEPIPSVITDDADFMGDLFSLSDEEGSEDIAAAMSWLDELAESNHAEATPTTDLVSSGMPPEDPEAAMAWLEQLAAAQAAELDDEIGVPSLDMDQSDEASLDWLEGSTVAVAESLELDKPNAAALPNWLDELAGTSPDDLLGTSAESTDEFGSDWLDSFAAAAPDEALSLEESAPESLPNWLDELAETPVDAPLLDEATEWLEPEADVTQPPEEDVIPDYPDHTETIAPTYVPPTNISAEAAKILDMSDLFDLGNVEESEEDMAQAMAWMNELMGDMGVSQTAEPSIIESDEPEQSNVEPIMEAPLDLEISTVELELVTSEEPESEQAVETTSPAEPMYIPPTTISAEAAKILDMSDLFDLGNVEESEEDMAQAMAWMEELIGNAEISRPEAESPLVEPTSEPVIVELEPLAEVQEPTAAADSSMAWLDNLAQPELETMSRPAAAASEDEAMAWLDEIVAEIGDEPVAAAPPITPPLEGEDEAMSWLDEIVADLSDGTTPAPEQHAVAPEVVMEAPTEPSLIEQPEPQVEPTTTQPGVTTATEAAHYIPPTDISPEAAKILDMSDLFDLGTVEESEEDMAQAMAWMAELMGDTGITPSPEGTPSIASEPESELPETVISATPVVEEDSAVDWLDDLASQETPFASLPDLEKAFTVEDLDVEPATEEDAAAALNWLNQMSLQQDASPEQTADITITAHRDDALLDELTNFPEDPDDAMDWLEQMAAQQSGGVEPTLAPKTPVVEEPRTPAVPPEVMDALAQVETKREKAKTGPLKPHPELFSEQPTVRQEPEQGTPLSLISELTSGDVAESLPDWLSLDAIGEEDSTLSWLSDKDLDATGWLESEAEMVDIEPTPVSLPLVTSTEPARDEPGVRREPTLTPPPVEPLNFQVNLDIGADEGAFAAARQLLHSRQYNDAIRSYTTLLETTPAITPVITELEGAVDTHPSQPLLRRLLGDAYMRNGQLQKALETYRKALDQL